MFIKMRNRLLLINMTILSLVTIAAFITIYLITYTNIQRENEQKLNSYVLQSVNESIADYSPKNAVLEKTTKSLVLPKEYTNFFILLLTDDSFQVLTYIDLPEEVFNNALGAWQRVSEGKISLEGREWQYKSSIEREAVIIQTEDDLEQYAQSYTKIAFLDITESARNLTQLLITFITVGIVMLAALFFVSLYFASRSIKSIEKMWEQQKQFVADASHELKTPLFAIKSNLAVVRTNSEATVESQSKWLNHADSATGRMGKLINDLLYLSKAETVMETYLPFNLSVMIEEAITSIEAIAYEKGIAINRNLVPQAIVSGERERLKQVVFILLDNAVKYVDEEGMVDVSVIKTRNHVRLTVSNTGEPIPKEELPKIFDRFYRIDKSRSNETGGYGLGLSIAKTIVERGGGKINVESNQEKTTFIIMLKKHN